MTTILVSSGEVVSGQVFGNGVTVTVEAGGTLVSSTITGSSSIWNHGAVSGLTIGSGSYLEVLTGSVAVDTIVRSGGEVYEQFGNSQSGGAHGTIVRSGGALWLANVTVSSGVFDFDGAQVAQGGVVVLYGDEVLSGGVLSTTANMFLQGGMTVSSGGTLEGGASFLLFNYDYGLVSGCAVGTASGTGSAYDNTNAILNVMAGGAASGVLVRNGYMKVSAGGSAVDTHVTSEGATGGRLFVHGTASATLVGYHAMEFVLAGGSETDALVESGGLAVVAGEAVDATAAQGILRVASGGLASGTRVVNGVETILSGGLAIGTVLSGGYEFVCRGVASGTVISSGGHELVVSGGIASASVVSDGGRAFAASGAVVADATVLDGGQIQVQSGAVVSGTLTLLGGKAIIGGAAAPDQTVDFAGSAGVLELRKPASFGAAIAGFGGADEKIDLDGMAYSSSATVNWSQSATSGALTVIEGGKIVILHLLGAYAGGDFSLSGDGHGGTIITAPGASATGARPQPADHFVAAVASLQGGRASAADVPVHASANTRADSPPLMTAAISGR